MNHLLFLHVPKRPLLHFHTIIPISKVIQEKRILLKKHCFCENYSFGSCSLRLFEKQLEVDLKGSEAWYNVSTHLLKTNHLCHSS